MNETDKETEIQQPPEKPGMRAAINIIMVILVVAAAFLGVQRILAGENGGPDSSSQTVLQSGDSSLSFENSASAADFDLAPFATPSDPFAIGLPRAVDPETRIPSRPRSDVITYTVQQGDSLFDIADRYGLKPETLLWSNFEILEDNPHLLSPDQVLFIPPVDGVYYRWNEGDTIQTVAASLNVDPVAITGYTANDLDLTLLNEGDQGLEDGDFLIVPGGSRPFKDWGPPAITRANPASAAYYGPGHCGSIYQGPVGNGYFIWPTVATYISGYGYGAIHRAIDIGGTTGNAIYAADAGVVVYSGWSNYGYGNLIVVDHGNGWQTAYAHLSSMAVGCGAGVFQGTVIGGMGSTGNSTGPHLHFEMVYNGTKPNPLDYVSP